MRLHAGGAGHRWGFVPLGPCADGAARRWGWMPMGLGIVGDVRRWGCRPVTGEGGTQRLRETRDEGGGTRGEGQGERDEGRGTRGEGRGERVREENRGQGTDCVAVAAGSGVVGLGLT